MAWEGPVSPDCHQVAPVHPSPERDGLFHRWDYIFIREKWSGLEDPQIDLARQWERHSARLGKVGLDQVIVQ